MSEELEIRLKIIKAAFEQFEQYGYTKSTMEDIAAGLHISKKTLYKYFRNKEEILRGGLYTYHCEVENKIDSILDDTSLEFLEKLRKMLLFIAERAKQFKGLFMDDLQKNNPSVYLEIQEFRKEKAYAKISRLITQGIDAGIFRDDVNKTIVLVMYTSAIQSVMNPDSLARLPLSGDDAFKNIITILFRGILTAKGREVYNEKLNAKKENYDEFIL